MAPLISDFSSIPSHVTAMPVDNARIEINEIIETATGLHYSENLAVKGAAGEGTTGAVGAIDRITHEILLSLEERKTLVVWLFDQTASLMPQRQAIRDRFEQDLRRAGHCRIDAATTRLRSTTTSRCCPPVVGFGSAVRYMTKKPTDSLGGAEEGRHGCAQRRPGTENVFSAILDVATQRRIFAIRPAAARRPSAT